MTTDPSDLDAFIASETARDPEFGPALERAELASEVATLRALVAEGIEAVRFTREYVGEDTLPAIEGWSWFDWTQAALAALGEVPK